MQPSSPSRPLSDNLLLILKIYGLVSDRKLMKVNIRSALEFIPISVMPVGFDSKDFRSGERHVQHATENMDLVTFRRTWV